MSGGLVGKVAGAALAFLASIVLARILGAEGYGRYAFAIAIMTVALVPAQLGIPSLIVRETARYKAERRWERVVQLWRWSIKASVVSACVVTICAVIMSLLMGAGFRSVLVIAAFTILPSTLNSVRAAMLRGSGHVAIGVMPEYLIKPFILIVAVALAAQFGNLGADGAIAANVIACVVTYAIGWAILKKLTPPIAWQITGPILEKTQKDWLSAAIWLSLLASSQVISQQVDIILVGALVDAQQAGVFKVAVSAGTLIVFSLNAVNLVTAPYFSRLIAQDNHLALQRLVTRSSQFTLLCAVPLCLALYFGSDFIVSKVYGVGFDGAASCIRILCVGQLVNAAFGAVSGLMTMARQQRTVAAVFSGSLIINICVSLFLIPVYGIEGAAVGSSLSLIIWNICLAVLAYRRLGIWTLALPRWRS
nr:flippase [Lysobacter antarcticus]